MIATLTGKVLLKGTERAVIDVGGVGYEVFVTSNTLAALPDRDEAFLHIHTHVREDAIVLYGFLDEGEKEMFLILRSVSGIGPKLALAILSGMRVGELAAAIIGQEIKLLTTLPGIGKRTAERLCVDLKEKVTHFSTGGVGIRGGGTRQGLAVAGGSAQADALSALANLGYPDPVARQALVAVKRQVGDEAFADLKVEELLRAALRTLA